jgi:hypothetical protein
MAAAPLPASPWFSMTGAAVNRYRPVASAVFQLRFIDAVCVSRDGACGVERATGLQQPHHLQPSRGMPRSSSPLQWPAHN